jgi:hypothetical protein
MTGTNPTRIARCQHAIVTAAIAAIVLCGGRASAWAATKGMPPSPPALNVGAGTPEGSSNRAPAQAATTAPAVADRYAERETSARNLENFKGGDVIIVGSTGVIIVLLVIIILLSL